MNKPNFIFKTFLFLLVLSAVNVFAQGEKKEPLADPCYEVVLQIVVASNTGGKSALTPALAGVVKKLKSNYSFSDYRLAATFLQRTSDSIEYKSMLNDFKPFKDVAAAPAFSEWSLRNLRNLPTSTGRRAIQFERFSFGARLPIGAAPAVTYENIGITTTRFNLNENEPTIVGSLATSQPSELMFLVLTVKAAE